MSTQDIINESEKLLSKNWSTEERLLIKRLLDNLISYKIFISRAVKKDIKDILILSNRIKDEYDEFKNVTH